MRKFTFSVILLLSSFFSVFSQSDFLTKKIPLAIKDKLYFEPLTLKGDRDETILVYLNTNATTKTPSLVTVVLDSKWNKIYEKETEPSEKILKMIGEMRGKIYVSVARFQAVDFGDQYGLFYERSTDLAYFTLSKKDYSIKQNADVELDTKVPITVFQRDRSIIKSFPYKDQLFVLYAGKEENQLTIASVKKNGKVDYKTIRIPQVKLDKGNGKFKELEFTKYDEFEWKNDSLFTFIFQTDNESKYFHTIVLNVEQMKASVMKYAYPSVGKAKDDDIYRGVYMLDDKIFLSSVNAEKCVVSIKNKSTGEEIKSFSFKNGDKSPFQNTPLVEKNAHFKAHDPTPIGVKIEPANVEKFWKKFWKGGEDGNIGAINVQMIDDVYRITLGYQDTRSTTSTSTTYVNTINPSQSANPGAIGTRSYSSGTSWDHRNSTEYYAYFDSQFEHLASQKKSSFEDAVEKAELRNSGALSSHSAALKSFSKGKASYFIYYDLDANGLVILGTKK